ncbi:UNVERIFIED_CONTAM: hypothetical protein FKN15_061641 [Acipenser sinensis]
MTLLNHKLGFTSVIFNSNDFTIQIGIIGGSGLDDPDILEGRSERYVETPYGKPSDALIVGKIKNVDCVLLASPLTNQKAKRLSRQLPLLRLAEPTYVIKLLNPWGKSPAWEVSASTCRVHDQ